MTTFAHLLLLAILGMTSLAASAAPVRYALDPVHTRVMFAVEHAGFSKALGAVSGTSGTLVFDPDDWAAARLDVSVPLQRTDLGDAKWNQATLARNLLDAERFPDARFVSTHVEANGENRAKVTGNLTLHGVTRPVTLDVTLNALKRHPLPPFRRTAGFSATATLSRAEFGIDAWKSMIGDTVELRIEAEAVREGRADDDAPQPQDAPTAPDTAAPPENRT
ncbi:YceI family protein [Xanthomonas sp. 3058]|uniref:YceI family protein n=1 Tax=Xanthomonas sp. 3058 TaxID=3035314 RepID=UPI001613DAE4|nr:YceI family protein [Xanthomonas sp. 3058]MBB5864003.1 polyisoprenoid-binding protein YceI [Xanthomonas sp. 3058]